MDELKIEQPVKKKSYDLPSWSIDIYKGASPFTMEPIQSIKSPVFQREMVTDVSAGFVADPFLMQYKSDWYLFMEVMNTATGLGEIGVAKSTNLMDWEYMGIVLRKNYHLSYPLIVTEGNELYMVPETLGANGVFLYKAIEFPMVWKPVFQILEGQFADSTLFKHENKWWMFTSSQPYASNRLDLYGSDTLTGNFVEHPMSPIVVEDRQIARPAGNVFSVEGKLYRLAQDCTPVYGTAVRVFEIKELTQESYIEVEVDASPLLNKGEKEAWNESGMHHFDAVPLSDGSWVAAVDGRAALM